MKINKSEIKKKYKNMEEKKLLEIIERFAYEGKVESVTPLGEGLINDTYLVRTVGIFTPDYVLQRINHVVFPNVEMLMRNIAAVTAHIRHKLEQQGVHDINRRCLDFMRLRDEPQRNYVEVEGQYWRLMVYIEDSVTKQAVDAETSRAAGLAFGQFEAMLADIPVELGETIPNFHNMEFRLRQLRQVVNEDPEGRAGEPQVQELLREIENRSVDMCRAERMGREGLLPRRVCHCDTKVNNMLYDREGNVLCVIDLDTVMPGFVFSDYGDFLRTGAAAVAEDFGDMQQVAFRMDIFRAFTEGYMQGAGAFLTPVEKENLAWAASLFPYMQCVRFLWDYLSGDHYWKCRYEAHNFIRALNQFHLLLDVERHMPEMEDFIKQLQ